MRRAMIFSALLLSVACGDDGAGSEGETGSGLPRDLRLGGIDESSVRTYCEWEVSLEGAGVEVACDGGSGRTVGVGHSVLQECIDQFVWLDDCTATIADAEACVTAALADPCREETTDGPRCAWVADCYANE